MADPITCPFCGSTNVGIGSGETMAFYTWIECYTCGARGPRVSGSHNPLAGEQIVTLWNTRAEKMEATKP